jgi:hypothetical protein
MALHLSMEAWKSPLFAQGPSLLDGFDDLTLWQAGASDVIRVSIHAVDGLKGQALHLDFDFSSVAGYASARLINRDGSALQPGSRAYERSWSRDGALTSEALLRLGHEDAVRDFLRWYTPYQLPNGKVPCCVDARGADPVLENDSHGEFIFLVSELFGYTHDRAMLEAI